jgi:hypothetical protein
MLTSSIHVFYQTIVNNIGVVAGIGVFIVAVLGLRNVRKIEKRTRPQIQTKVKIRKVSPLNLNPDKIRWWEFWKK